MKVYSPIAIDLGGKNTGVYMAHRNEGCDNVDTRGAVVVASADKVTWSQQERTAKRHQRRGLTRKRLVRRLLWQILDAYGVKYSDVLPKTSEFINGLLKRRGFSYLTDDNSISAEDVSGIDVEVFSTSVENNFDLKKFSSAADIVKKLEEGELIFIEEVNSAFSKSKKDIEKNISQRLLELELVDDEKTSKEIIKEYSQVYIDIRNLTDNLIKNLKGGHKPRREYFENIRKDIKANECLLGNVLEKLSITPIEFSFLVGNLSNLQLRTLRRYFNDLENKKDDKYKKEKLFNVFKQWVLSWHCKTDKDKKQRKDLCDILNHKNDIFSILIETNPLLTTPPYEDQNNRNPIKDLTLLLDDKKLDAFVFYQNNGKQISCWREIADSFLLKGQLQLQDGLDEICKLNDRKPSAEYLKSLTNKENNIPNGLPSFEDKKRMYFLQRLFDCSKAIDPYCFRKVASLEWNEFKGSYLYENIKEVFRGSEHLIEPLYLLVRQYYKEEVCAADGIWTAKTSMMFRTSDVNPPRKSKIMHIIVGQILGVKFESIESLNDFISVLDAVKIQYEKEIKNKNGKIILKSFNKQFWKALEHIEETRKSYANIFKEVYADAVNKKFEGHNEEEKVALENCVIFVEKVVRVLADILKHSDGKLSRYNNPFSLAQLYTIIKKDIHGFSSTCEAVAKENQWRSTMVEFEDEKGDIQTTARCKRMSADCVRPFDGMLSRIVERQVQKIADLKFEQIKDMLNSSDSTLELTIPIVLEENAFTFTEGLIVAKTGKKPTETDKKKLDKLMKRTEKWVDKDTRIKEASCGICPYTGAALGESGEYDHIIPRSKTKKKYGTVFNHEANLIYCSNRGNIDKNDLQYSLENLNDRYLQKVFNLSSTGFSLRKEIKEQIKKTIDRLSKGSIFYQSLSIEEQRDIRHALFMPCDNNGETYKTALKILQTNQMSRVNGTQAFFAKRFIEALDERIKQYSGSIKLNVFVEKAKAEDVSDLRRRLESIDDKWKKVHPQPAFSHITDAMLSLLVVEPTDFNMGVFSLPNELQGSDFDSGIEQFVSNKLPTSWSIELLKRTNFSDRKASSEGLFNDSIYKEHFVPVWGCKGNLYVGFKREQIFRIKKDKASEIFDGLRPFLTDCPNCSLDELSEELKCYPLDKQKTIEWMFEKSKSHEIQDNKTYQSLLGLHYVTIKTSLSKILLDQNKKILSKEDVISKCVKNIPIDNSMLESNSKLEPPFISEITSLLNKVDSYKNEYKNSTPEEIVQIINDELLQGEQVERSHKRVRKQYSLPVIPTLGGELIWVRRQSWDGKYIYQLLSPKNTFNLGFAKHENKLDFDDIQRFDFVDNSKNLATLNLYNSSSSNEVESFFSWRDIYASKDSMEENLKNKLDEFKRNGVESLEISPRQKSRMCVRVKMSLELLKKISDIKSTEMLPTTIVWKKCDLEFAKCFTARKTLFIKKVFKESVVVEYETSSSTAFMKELYNAAR